MNDSTYPSTSIQLSGLQNNVVYYWRVRALSLSNQSSFSVSWKFTTIVMAPEIPLQASPQSGTSNNPVLITLKWKSVEFASEYHLQVSTDSPFQTLVYNDSLIADTSRLVGVLHYNTTYYWRVRAKNINGSKGFSDVWSFNTTADFPGVPVLVSPTSSSINQPLLTSLRWNAVSKATSYHLQVSTDSPFHTLMYNDSLIADTSRFVGSLNYNTTYYWRVRSKNSNGSQGFSDVWSFRTAMKLPEIPVLALPPSSSINQPVITSLRWNAVSNATSYRLQVSTDSPFKVVVHEDSTIADTSRQVVGLKNNTHYYWIIQAANVAGTSAYSDVWSFTTTIGAPITPTLISPSSASVNRPTNATLHWKPIANATAYSIQVATDSPFDVKVYDDSTLTDTLYQLSNLLYNTKYYWRVSARNIGGSSSFSEVWNFTTMMQPPEIPLLFSPASALTNQPTKTLLCWNSSPGSTVYHIQLALDSPFGTTVFEDSSHADTSVTISNLKNETKYYWRVRGRNNSGFSAFSTIWNFTTMMAVPNVPSLVFPMNAAGNEPNTLALKWNPALHAQSYHVQVSDDSPFKTIVFEDSTLTDTTMALSPLRAETRYYWRVRSINSGGVSLFSEIWNFKTSTTLGVQRESDDLPKTFALQQNFPNPFNPSTTISFALAEQALVTVTVYDILGRVAATIVNEDLSAGYYHVQWRAENMSAGVYFYRIVAQKTDKQNPFIQLKKMLLLK